MAEHKAILLFLISQLWIVNGVLVQSVNQEGGKKVNAIFMDVDITLEDDVNFRGLAIHNSSVWIGGFAGFVLRLKGEGQMHGQIEAAKEYQMRDIAIFDEAEIVMLGSGPKARYAHRYERKNEIEPKKFAEYFAT